MHALVFLALIGFECEYRKKVLHAAVSWKSVVCEMFLVVSCQLSGRNEKREKASTGNGPKTETRSLTY